MDDYETMHNYVNDQQHNYSTVTNVNEMEHQMLQISPQDNLCYTDRNDKLTQNDITVTDPLKATKRCLILVAVLMVITLFICSVAAIVLSTITYSTFHSKISQLHIASDDIISVTTNIKSNISQLLIQLDDTNNDITSAATAIKSNISQLHIQLDAVNRLAISVQAEITRIHCGAGEWHRVAYLNMSDPLQQCPSAWREYSTSNTTACGRAFSYYGSCSSTTFLITSGWYHRVCGRVIGYQFGSTDAFKRYGNNDIDLDGVNITHGTQRHHIWSYVAGVTEGSSQHTLSNCPCSTQAGTQPQSFIRNNFYCESGNTEDTLEPEIYSSDPLWDGQQCEGTCCNGTNSPPWFSVQLPAPTNNTIQVSICGDELTDNEDTLIALLEIYVQ